MKQISGVTLVAQLLTAVLLCTCLTACEDNGGGGVLGAGYNFGDNDPNTMLAMGDSITAGSSNPGGIPYPARLAAATGRTVVNRGNGGTSSSYGAGTVNNNLLQYKPGYLLILYGIIDIENGASEDVIIANLRTMITAARNNQTIPVLATLTPVFDSHEMYAASVRSVNERIRQLAGSENVPLADVGGALEGQRQLFLEDGLHPNDEGEQAIASVFYGVLM